jgi:type I restriction enzyme, S subunit
MRDGWETVPLGVVVRQVSRPCAVKVGARYPLLGVRWYGGGPFIREIGVGGHIKATRLFKVEVGDFIYNRLFAWKGSFGVIAEQHSDCYVSGEFPLFECDVDRLIPTYLSHVMCRPHVWAQIERESTGSTATSRNRWKEARFLDWEIALPPLVEQRRIVDLIDTVDCAVAATTMPADRAVSAMSAFDAELIAEVEDLPTVQMGDCAEIQGGITKSAKRLLGDDAVELPYLRVANVQRGWLDLKDVTTITIPPRVVDQLLLHPGDILFNEGGDRDKLGRGWVWEGQLTSCIHQNHVFRARLHQGSGFDPYFVSIWGNSFGRIWFEENGTQTTNLASINKSNLRRFPLPAVPLEAQRQHVDRYLALRDLSTAAIRQSESLASLRSALLSDLLSGEHEIPNAYDALLETDA